MVDENNDPLLKDIHDFLSQANSKEVAKLIFDIKKTNQPLAEKIFNIYKEIHKDNKPKKKAQESKILS